MRQIFTFIIALVFLGLSPGIGAQNTLIVQVTSADDDLEEYIDDPSQSQTVGSIDAGSSDLELGSEDEDGSAAQVVGIRFANVDLPAGAVIASARIQFTVDETKSSDPASLLIRAQNDPDPAAFEVVNFNISSRPAFTDAVSWEIAADTWLNAGESGPDQLSPEVAGLVQSAVGLPGWAPGNAIVFMITGTGTRVAESYDGSPDQAPKLIIEWYPANAARTLVTQVASADDDLEEYAPDPNQSNTVGSIDAGSSDLELGSEDGDGTAAQYVGVRFATVDIPVGSVITNARIQFTVDETKSNDPASIIIKAQDDANPTTFEVVDFNISSRPTLNDSVSWDMAGDTWLTAGESGPEQLTTNIASLVQALVDKGDWQAGNAMLFIFSGTGTRVAESYDGSPDQAAKLIIDYISPVVPVSVGFRVSASDDDMEEYLPDPMQTNTVGSMDAGSSDLELGSESGDGSDKQLVGIRFATVDIPAGSIIESASIQFTVDENKSTDDAQYFIKAQSDPDPKSFDVNTPFDISSRPTFSDSVEWNVTGGTWTNAGDAGPDQQTTDISALLQQVIDQPGWTAGNAVVFTIVGTGNKVAESYDGSPDQAPLLQVDYLQTKVIRNRVSASDDDMEEYLPDAMQTNTIGSMDAGSSDLELGSESGDGSDKQLVGIRFVNVELMPGEQVQSAFIQFTVDENKNTDNAQYYIKAQSDPNPLSFDVNTPFNISSRPTFADSIEWNVTGGTWTNAGDAGPDQRTSDISSLINKVINQPGWEAGNAIVFTIAGTGNKVAESFDGSPDQAPELIVTVLSTSSGLPPAQYPIGQKANWSYWDNGQDADGDWTVTDFDDTVWDFGAAPLGYNRGGVATTLAGNGIALFRKTVLIDDLSLVTDSVGFSMLVDDNATVYVNGVEVLKTENIRVMGKDEDAYFLYAIPKTAFVEGENYVAVKVTSVDADLIFDASIENLEVTPNDPGFNCDGTDDAHISCFETLVPVSQDDYIGIPQTHAFQYIVRKDDPYTDGSGVHGDDFDFTGYVPIDGSSRHGYLSINYEDVPGGVGICEIQFDKVTGLWEVLNSTGVDFSALGGTQTNCSGAVTPWGTVITCEEDVTTNDVNGDGYFDIGWCIEIDPKTAEVRDYGTGSPQKLWALGRMDHENVVIKDDFRTVYLGEDSSDGSLYKFIADNPEDLTSGALYVLVVDDPFNDGEPTGTTGTWVEVPNTTIEERNMVKANAQGLGATLFSGIEDADISPISGEIFFAVKGVGRVYVFTDDGNTVSNFRTHVGGRSYTIEVDGKRIIEPWQTGNDNLTFDDRGNLYVLQDGGRNFIWMVGPDHTQVSPQVKIFFHTPAGAEPTGMTFTPDFQYMFMSIQSPNGASPQADVAGTEVIHDLDVALCIAREENLGFGVEKDKFTLRVMHNNDGESKLEPRQVGNRLVGGAAPFKSMVDGLRKEDLSSILLSSGDNFLAGIAFNASLNRGDGKPYYDAEVLDALDYDAICLGNHDFDFGPDVLEKMILDFQITQPPYLGANLDFSAEPGLQALVNSGRIAASTTFEVDGEMIGVVGISPTNLASISSPRGVIVLPDIEGIAQAEVDKLTGQGVNKIILISHQQSINNEIDLAAKLTGVDVIIAGGGDELLTNDASIALPGIPVFDEYPVRVVDAAGDTTLIVTTPGEYRYVGNLVLDFDADGNVVRVHEESNPLLVSEIIPDSVLQADVVDSVIIYSANLDANIIANTDVDIDGTRNGVRTRETNQGNIIADAFLWLGRNVAEQYDLDPAFPIVAIQNGGGIRNDEVIPAGSNISEKKTFDMLPFDNKVTIVNPITPEQFKEMLENSVSNVENVDGRFAQIAGFRFVYDPNGQAGSSRVSHAILDDGTPMIINGIVARDAPNVYVVTNSFTADGGDDYTTFADAGVLVNIGASYQRALFDYIVAADGLNGFISGNDYPAGGEGRILIDQVYDVSQAPAQLSAMGGFTVEPLFTVGQTIDDYTPVGILDGMGAIAMGSNTVRILVNHELTSTSGNRYFLGNGASMRGARVSYIDVDRTTNAILGSGLAYHTIVNRDGTTVTSEDELEFGGLNRLCSAGLFRKNTFALEDDIFFTGEETDGGTEFALDVQNNTLYAAPWLGRAAWENVTLMDAGPNRVAVLIGDDRAPAPLLMYIGDKDGNGDFLERNGLKNGKLYVWVADDGSTTPEEFKGTGASRDGQFVEIKHFDSAQAGNGMYDDLGFATQETQDALAEAAGAFLFSRPEDVATNPFDGSRAVLASTGRGQLYPSDNWGVLIDVNINFTDLSANLRIIYDGDDAGDGQFPGPDYGLRSPDNLDWASDGWIYVQEDKSTSPGSLFGGESGEEASVWRVDPRDGMMTRIGKVDRSAVPEGQTDSSPADIGNWETSGIIDVSDLFDASPSEVKLLMNVQAHAIRDGVIEYVELAQGGQIALLTGERDDIVSTEAPFSSEYPLTIAPNPVQDIVRVQCELERSADVRVELFNTNGQFVDELLRQKDAWSIQLEYDMSKLQQGQYFVRITVDSTVQSFGLIKI